MWLSAEALTMNHETKKALLNRCEGPSIHLLSYSFEEWIERVLSRPGDATQKQMCQTGTAPSQVCLGSIVSL